jgi:hypothetical protein
VLTANSPTYSHTSCGSSNYHYEAIQVNVTESGCYSFGSNSSINIFVYIHKDKFDPFNPSTNSVARLDAKLINTQVKVITHLQAGTPYVLVVTTWSPNVIGTFSIIVSGPNKVNLNRLSEYLH